MITFTHEICLASILVFLTVAGVACSSDPKKDDTMTLDECQAACEEDFEEDLADSDCNACGVTCTLEEPSGYACIWQNCNEQACAEKCDGTDYPIGKCNEVIDTDFYWGCNCFSNG